MLRWGYEVSWPMILCQKVQKIKCHKLVMNKSLSDNESSVGKVLDLKTRSRRYFLFEV